MSTTRLTLLDIYHPVFRKGYQNGRQHYFREQTLLTDKELVACLQSLFEPTGQDQEAEEPEEGLSYAIGHLVGHMSGCVIPRQPHEDNTRCLQETFLVKVLQTYGSAGQSLVDAIRQWWAIQDQLAQTLDADTFEQMLHCGEEKW